MTPTHPLTIRRLAMITERMGGKSMTIAEIATAVSRSPDRARTYANYMCSIGAMHIKSFDPSIKGPNTARYQLGAGKNAINPGARSAKKHAASERARMRALKKDPEAYGVYLSKQRVRHMTAKAVKVPNTWFGALPNARSEQKGAQP